MSAAILEFLWIFSIRDGGIIPAVNPRSCLLNSGEPREKPNNLWVMIVHRTLQRRVTIPRPRVEIDSLNIHEFSDSFKMPFCRRQNQGGVTTIILRVDLFEGKAHKQLVNGMIVVPFGRAHQGRHATFVPDIKVDAVPP